MTTPGWLNAGLSVGGSPPPHELEISVAPSTAAVCSAAYRLALALLSASTSRMRQLGQIPCATSTSVAISCAQPRSGSPLEAGSGEALPLWLTLRKQPLASVHAGRPNWLSKTCRSSATFVSSKASTSAIVWPLGGVASASP